MRTYTVVLEREDDGGFSVSVPALPGCYTQGDDLENALANAREAIQCHVEALAMDGEAIPGDVSDFDLLGLHASDVLIRRVSIGEEALAVA